MCSRRSSRARCSSISTTTTRSARPTIGGMEAASAGAPEGSVFLAEEQTAGRGRGGNAWHSARSTGIYCSVVLRPALPAFGSSRCCRLRSRLAVRDAIRELDPALEPDLKWPNDLLLDGKKFCGILTEMNAEAYARALYCRRHWHQRESGKFSRRAPRMATSLLVVSGSEWSRVELAAALLKSLHREYRELMEGPEPANRFCADLRSILLTFAEARAYRGKRRRGVRGHNRGPRSARLSASAHRRRPACRFERNSAGDESNRAAIN